MGLDNYYSVSTLDSFRNGEISCGELNDLRWAKYIFFDVPFSLSLSYST